MKNDVNDQKAIPIERTSEINDFFTVAAEKSD